MTFSHSHPYEGGDRNFDQAATHLEPATHGSLLRMTVMSRLAVAVATSAGLWGIVWLAMR